MAVFIHAHLQANDDTITMARPTKYLGEETIRLSKEYIASCVDVPEKKIVKLPKAAGLALYLDVSKDSLYEWAKVYPEFSDILDRLNNEQEQRLIDSSLSGAYNATIAKLVLGKHGYKDEADITTKGDKLNADADKIKALEERFIAFIKGNNSGDPA